tara:strand:- start:2110 stop:2517 length:408 start_codon:yes stop_codon:yes gene_type:complete
MSNFWRKSEGADDFIEIARIALGKNIKEDYTEWCHYANPMHFCKYPVFHKGFETLLAEWRNEVNSPKIQKSSYLSANLNLKVADEFEEWRNLYLIRKVDDYLSRHLRWSNSQNPKQQFGRAKDIFIYFQKEANYQ